MFTFWRSKKTKERSSEKAILDRQKNDQHKIIYKTQAIVTDQQEEICAIRQALNRMESRLDLIENQVDTYSVRDTDAMELKAIFTEFLSKAGFTKFRK